MPRTSLATISPSMDGRFDRQVPKHLNQPRETPAESRPDLAVRFDVIAQLVDLDGEAVELDLVLPVVAGWHRVGAHRCGANQLWSLNGTVCALPRHYIIAGPQTVLTMSLPENQRGRLARDIFPAKHSPDWHQNDETRHELEKLYAEWGLDIRRLRGERPHTRVIAAPSVSLRKKRRSRAKSHWMK
jgi:hypothetical protein